MEFSEFFLQMSMYYCNHATMTYGNYLFLKEFVSEIREFPNESFQSFLPPNNDPIHLSPQKTKFIIDTLKNLVKMSHHDTVMSIWVFNNEAINARAINVYYELIKKYLNSRDKGEFYQFHDNHDWFKVLYVLRQNTSHGGYVFKRGIEFPDRGKTLGKHIKPYPDTIQWGNISITRGQKTAPEINLVQVSSLLSHILIYFAGNKDFNVGISHTQNIPKP